MVERLKLEFDRKRLAKEVKSKRIVELNIELREAAWQVGVSAATLCRLESGEKLPDVNTLANLCHWLNVPMETFYKSTPYYEKDKTRL